MSLVLYNAANTKASYVTFNHHAFLSVASVQLRCIASTMEVVRAPKHPGRGDSKGIA
jgi:hypothetical protein